MIHALIDLTYLLFLWTALCGGGYAFYFLFKKENQEKENEQRWDDILNKAKMEIMQSESEEFTKMLHELQATKNEIKELLQQVRHEPK